MHRALAAIGLLLLLASDARGQEPPVEIPPVDRSPFETSGFLEARPAFFWLDTDAALYELRALDDDTLGARSLELNSRVQFDVGYRRGWFGAQTRVVGDARYASGRWTTDATAFEAYVSLKPAPTITIDAGKKTMKWGKGYLWTPAAFLDRMRNPDDPSLPLEGFTVLSADYIRTFSGPLQVMSVTPVLLPVFGRLNQAFGEEGHLNVAAKLYVLLLDTDIDAMVLGGGSRPSRFGFDVSRNLRPNLEVHGEWVRVPHSVTVVLSPDDTLTTRERPATSLVAGLRYLTDASTTFIIDYYRNGDWYTPDEMDVFFTLIDRGAEAWDSDGDDQWLRLAGRASAAAYGRMAPMQHYVYGRVSQPDALGVLYLSLGASAIVNVADGSVNLLPEVLYKPTANMELRWLGGIQYGGFHTEFGEKAADARFEIRARYYF